MSLCVYPVLASLSRSPMRGQIWPWITLATHFTDIVNKNNGRVPLPLTLWNIACARMTENRQTWICSISSGANSFCPSPPKNSFRSPPVLPSTSRSMKKSRSCSTPEIRCYNCVNNGYGSKKFMIYLIGTRYLYLSTLPLPCFPYVVSFWLLAKKKFKIMTWMHGHCHYDRVLSWSGAKQHSRRETPLLKSLHKIWCNAPRTCTRHQGVEQFFAPGAEWYPSLPISRHISTERNICMLSLGQGQKEVCIRAVWTILDL